VIVLDTTVLVDVLRGDESAASYLLEFDDVPACSELSRVETLRGLRSGEQRAAEQLFGALRWLHVDETVAREAGELGRRFRRSHAHIGVVDLVIAASALLLSTEVATTNTRHFPMFPGLQPPY